MALVSNGSSQYSLHTLTTSINTANAFTIAFTFRTGATVTGSVQIPFNINRASSFARGWGVEISSAGLIRGFNETGSRTYTTTLATAAPNTVYTVVMTKASTTTGTVTFYLNTFANSALKSTTLSVDLTRIITGAMFSNVYQEYFGGKVGRIAFWPSILSNADVTVCLNNAQTPANCSVAPQDYWIAISNDTPTNGSNATVRTGTAYDSDTLSAAEISTITDPITIGSAFSFTGASWAGGTFTSITTNVTGSSVSGISGSTSSGSATLSGWVDGAAHAQIPTAVTFTFNDGTTSATKASNISLPSGYTKLPLSAPVTSVSTTIGGAILAQTGRTVVTNDVFYHTSYGDLVITPDTSFTVTDAGSFDLWLYVSSGADAGKNYYYAVTITESGDVVISNGLTTAGLTSSGLTRAGLTYSGL